MSPGRTQENNKELRLQSTAVGVTHAPRERGARSVKSNEKNFRRAFAESAWKGRAGSEKTTSPWTRDATSKKMSRGKKRLGERALATHDQDFTTTRIIRRATTNALSLPRTRPGEKPRNTRSERVGSAYFADTRYHLDGKNFIARASTIPFGKKMSDARKKPTSFYPSGAILFSSTQRFSFD